MAEHALRREFPGAAEPIADAAPCTNVKLLENHPKGIVHGFTLECSVEYFRSSIAVVEPSSKPGSNYLEVSWRRGREMFRGVVETALKVHAPCVLFQPTARNPSPPTSGQEMRKALRVTEAELRGQQPGCSLSGSAACAGRGQGPCDRV